jgi:hypothetical protein
MNFTRMTLLTASMALAGALIASPVVAQKAPATPTTKTKTKTKTVKKKAAPKKAPKTAARQSAAKTAPKKTATKKKTPSACAGLTQSRCKANKVCGWIKPKKAVSTNGRKLTPYCRKVAGIAKKTKKKAK